ncbi:hypothetical protein SDC9_211162 [bioreactor metagenome]|uniref:Uncharacterized protein n=1 Tax=bioreactor metagenome TaxID=1076179 RepID=A0A645JU06_9ZZZZ
MFDVRNRRQLETQLAGFQGEQVVADMDPETGRQLRRALLPVSFRLHHDLPQLKARVRGEQHPAQHDHSEHQRGRHAHQDEQNNQRPQQLLAVAAHIRRVPDRQFFRLRNLFIRHGHLTERLLLQRWKSLPIQ